MFYLSKKYLHKLYSKQSLTQHGVKYKIFSNQEKCLPANWV
jgi:hypothetical protein